MFTPTWPDVGEVDELSKIGVAAKTGWAAANRAAKRKSNAGARLKMEFAKFRNPAE
jgi:hypothetical protein